MLFSHHGLCVGVRREFLTDTSKSVRIIHGATTYSCMHSQNESQPATPKAQMKQALLAQAAQRRRETTDDQDATAKEPQTASDEARVYRISTPPSWSALHD